MWHSRERLCHILFFAFARRFQRMREVQSKGCTTRRGGATYNMRFLILLPALLLLPTLSWTAQLIPVTRPTSHPITSLLGSSSRPTTRPAASQPAKVLSIDKATTSTLPTTLPTTRPAIVAPSRLDLNTASAEQLARLPGMDSTRAAMVVQFRTTHGAFRSVDGILEVQGISENRLHLFREKVTVAPAAK